MYTSPMPPLVLHTNNGFADVQLQEQIKLVPTQLQVETITTSQYQVIHLSIHIRVHVDFEPRLPHRASRQMSYFHTAVSRNFNML